jgi:hypothetical protein
MAYVIKTPEHHTAERARHGADNLRRLDFDVEDVGLSAWASSSMMDFHSLALDALALGEAHGFDGPAVLARVLVDAEGNIVSDTVDTSYFNGVAKQGWRLTPAQRTALGRYNVPVGEKSRVQRTLGLREEERVLPASRYVEAECAFRGAPLVFTVKPARAA